MTSWKVGDGNSAQRNNVKTLPFFRAQWTDIFTSSNSNFKETYLINCLDLTSWLDEKSYALENKKIHISLPLTSLKQAKLDNSTFTRSKAVSSPSISKNIFHLCSWGAKKKINSRGTKWYLKNHTQFIAFENKGSDEKHSLDLRMTIVASSSFSW